MQALKLLVVLVAAPFIVLFLMVVAFGLMTGGA